MSDAIEVLKDKCFFCGRKPLRQKGNKSLTKHHVKPRSLNLLNGRYLETPKYICLCRCCHKDIHILKTNLELNLLTAEEQKDILINGVFEKEALLALKQKEKFDNLSFVCDVCGEETASCLSLCPDCNDRKQGALEELKRLYKSFSIFHAENCAELKLIEKRIKELEEGEVKK